MHASTRFRLVALGLVAVFGLALFAAPTPATAGKPVTGGGSDAGTASLGIDCGSFEVLDRYTIEWTEKTFFDKAGTEITFAEQVWGTDTFINSETGAEYPTTFHNSVRVDRSTGLGASTGIIFRLTVPGVGAVFLEVGRVVSNRSGSIVTFQAGPRQWSDGDTEALCAALA